MPTPPPKHTNAHPQILSSQKQNPKFFRQPPLRTPSSSSSHSLDSSFRSSSSSFSSIDQEFPLFSPTTPLKLKGIPFSWEQTPGIPKRHSSVKNNNESSRQLLPLPPAAPRKWHKYNNNDHMTSKTNHKDPFLAALLECSKKDDRDSHYFGGIWKGSTTTSTTKVARSISDRFGLINMYANYSCKSTCAVSEATVYLPRSSSSHSLINRHSS